MRDALTSLLLKLFFSFAVAVSLFTVPSQLPAQLPATRLSAVFPSGGNPGKTVEVTIDGADLDDVSQLLFSHPGITAKQKMAEPGPFDKGPQPVANQFEVAIAANVPAGIFEARAQGKYGLSNPRAFMISDIPDAAEVEPNENKETATEITLPAMIDGRSNRATDVDFYKFTATAGQRIIASGYTRSIDSRIDTILAVYDSAGKQLASSRDDKGFDSLIDVTVAAGEYYLKVRDAAYLGGSDYPYRISVGVLPHIDYIFPPAGTAGANGSFEVFGRNLPGGQPSGLTLDGRPLEKIPVSIPLASAAAAQNQNVSAFLVPAAAGLDFVEYRVKSPQGSSNPVMVGISSSPLVPEALNNDRVDQAQLLTLPCEILGQFYPSRDQDWFQFEAKKDDSLSIEVISQRMGVRSNATLFVQRIVKPAEADQPEQTQQLSFVAESGTLDGGPEFDTRNDDPAFRFIAPADGTYRIMIRDTFNDIKADPRRVYRLAIHGNQPDFRLAATPEGSFSSLLLRKGGQAGIRVVAFRRDGFAGEIKVSAASLPAGVSCEEVTIGPESNSAMLTLVAAPNAAAASAMITVSGKSTVGNAEVTRVARFGTALAPTVAKATANQAVPAVESRIARNLAVSIAETETALVTLQAGGGQVWENSRGAQLKIPYTRGGPFLGAINFIPRGLPANVTAPVGNVAANATAGEFQINLLATTPTGTYTFYLDAVATQVDYVRNPEAAAAAAARKIEVDQIKVKADADAKAATDAKTAADKLATDTAAAVTAATTAKAAADKALADATAAAKVATDNAAVAQAAAVAKPDDAALKTAAATAQKAADDAAANVKTGTDAVTAAEKALVDATAIAKTAADAKVITDKNAADATELAKQATALKTTTDALATATANAANPQKRNVPIVSTPITLKITPAPITFAQPVAATPVKQGEMLEVPLAITRLYEYKGAVTVNTVLPGGLAGVSVPNVTIPADMVQAKLTITVAANATEGEHTLTVRTTSNLNGQNLVVEQPLKIVVAKAAPK